MNLNKVIIIGRLTVDPQLRTTTSGKSVTSFGVATNRFWTDASGNKQEETEFHNIVVWGRQAEIVNQYLKKGSLVMIEGRLRTRTWQGNDGQNKRTTEVIAERIQFGPRSAGAGPPAQAGNFPSSSGTPKEGGKKDINGKKDVNGKEDTDKKDGNKEEKIPEINIDEEGEEIKSEDIPF